MPTITLHFKNVKIKEYHLVAGKTYSIGRKHSNDIVINHPTVSGAHAQIESLATTFILRDLESTNGTYIDNHQVILHHLRHNDEITIGNHKLFFDRSDILAEKPAIESDYDVDKTRIFMPAAARGMHPKAADFPASGVTMNAIKGAAWWRRWWQKFFG